MAQKLNQSTRSMKQFLILFSLLGFAFLAYLATTKKQNPVHIIKSKLSHKPTTVEVVNHLHGKVVAQLKPNLKKAGLSTLPAQLLMIAYKEEQLLKVYGHYNSSWNLIKTYPFTATSGQLGPKLKEGDKQIPEGIYKIEYLNPASLFYLSMKVNYPNAFDKKKGQSDKRTDLGSDIFIHGKAATIGCIPIGDEAIEELFIMAEAALSNELKVIISPRDFLKGKPYPDIKSVTWSEELYDLIKEELELVIGD